jgi:hypothetical protein
MAKVAGIAHASTAPWFGASTTRRGIGKRWILFATTSAIIFLEVHVVGSS